VTRQAGIPAPGRTAGAIAIGSLAFFIAKRRKRSLLGLPVQLPASTEITPRLVLGSTAFGIGWGLAGFRPGPALVAMGAGYPKAGGFVAAMDWPKGNRPKDAR